MKRGIALGLLAAAFFTASMLAQAHLTARRDRGWMLERMTYLPQSDRLKPLLCGFTTAFADFLWIKTTLYFGGHNLTDKQYPYLINQVDM
ncbi:MAG: hypothetical protein PHC61_13820, partial [Chitinivibrionales bacterium]|nr:hypothetical protein [Chitinivibrionales bacterium]